VFPGLSKYIHDLYVGIARNKLGVRKVHGKRSGRPDRVGIEIKIHAFAYTASPVCHTMIVIRIALVAVSDIIAAANGIVELVIALECGTDPVGINTSCELRFTCQRNKKQNEYGSTPGVQCLYVGKAQVRMQAFW
jgi:hypothetical protein